MGFFIAGSDPQAFRMVLASLAVLAVMGFLTAWTSARKVRARDPEAADAVLSRGVHFVQVLAGFASMNIIVHALFGSLETIDDLVAAWRGRLPSIALISAAAAFFGAAVSRVRPAMLAFSSAFPMMVFASFAYVAWNWLRSLTDPGDAADMEMLEQNIGPVVAMALSLPVVVFFFALLGAAAGRALRGQNS